MFGGSGQDARATIAASRSSTESGRPAHIAHGMPMAERHASCHWLVMGHGGQSPPLLEGALKERWLGVAPRGCAPPAAGRGAGILQLG